MNLEVGKVLRRGGALRGPGCGGIGRSYKPATKPAWPATAPLWCGQAGTKLRSHYFGVQPSTPPLAMRAQAWRHGVTRARKETRQVLITYALESFRFQKIRLGGCSRTYLWRRLSRVGKSIDQSPQLITSSLVFLSEYYHHDGIMNIGLVSRSKRGRSAAELLKVLSRSFSAARYYQ